MENYYVRRSSKTPRSARQLGRVGNSKRRRLRRRGACHAVKQHALHDKPGRRSTCASTCNIAVLRLLPSTLETLPNTSLHFLTRQEQHPKKNQLNQHLDYSHSRRTWGPATPRSRKTRGGPQAPTAKGTTRRGTIPSRNRHSVRRSRPKRSSPNIRCNRPDWDHSTRGVPQHVGRRDVQDTTFPRERGNDPPRRRGRQPVLFERWGQYRRRAQSLTN